MQDKAVVVKWNVESHTAGIWDIRDNNVVRISKRHDILGECFKLSIRYHLTK